MTRTFEVFLKKAGKDEFRHAGALNAPDAEMAKLLARDCYSRRGEGAALWLIDRADIVSVDPGTLAATTDQPHRHNDGAAIAARRKSTAGNQAGTGSEATK